jgi:hypothetical protein
MIMNYEGAVVPICMYYSSISFEGLRAIVDVVRTYFKVLFSPSHPD